MVTPREVITSGVLIGVESAHPETLFTESDIPNDLLDAVVEELRREKSGSDAAMNLIFGMTVKSNNGSERFISGLFTLDEQRGQYSTRNSKETENGCVNKTRVVVASQLEEITRK